MTEPSLDEKALNKLRGSLQTLQHTEETANKTMEKLNSQTEQIKRLQDLNGKIQTEALVGGTRITRIEQREKCVIM